MLRPSAFRNIFEHIDIFAAELTFEIDIAQTGNTERADEIDRISAAEIKISTRLE